MIGVNNMLLRGLMDEDIVNYHKTSMYLAFPYCTFKCDKECGNQICQNSSLVEVPIVEITPENICERYLNNPLTSAIVCGGLEPFDSKFDLLALVDCLRRKYSCRDEIIIYTGYTEEELKDPQNNEQHFIFQSLCLYSNIIIKFGRFIPNTKSHYDEILGIELASSNQYAKKVS